MKKPVNNEQKTIEIIRPKIHFQQEISIQDISFSDEASVSEIKCNGGMIASISAEKVAFAKSTFHDITFRETILQRADFSDVIFVHCNLANTNWSRSIMHRVEFVDCNMTGVDFGEATLRNVSIQKCSARYAFFRGADMSSVCFSHSELSQSDFQQTKLHLISFTQSILTAAQMSGCNLSGMDLSDCDIDGLQARLEDFAGAIVSPMQALDLVKIMGVIVK